MIVDSLWSSSFSLAAHSLVPRFFSGGNLNASKRTSGFFLLVNQWLWHGNLGQAKINDEMLLWHLQND